MKPRCIAGPVVRNFLSNDRIFEEKSDTPPFRLNLAPKKSVKRVHFSLFSFFCSLIEAKRRVNPIYIYMRKLRILQQGVWYEIHTQINNREPLFCEDTARKIFEQVFHETGLKFVFEIRGRRLEGDLLTFYIKPEDGLQLPDIMKWMKQTFAQRYNRAMGRTGHIWGDRYWSRILEGEPPEEAAGGRAKAPANGVRPPRGKNEAAPGFRRISPRSTTPAPG
jgi:hypothetical protein